MSEWTTLVAQVAEALQPRFGDTVTLLPANQQFAALIEPVTEKTYGRLKIGNASVTDVIHINRTLIEQADPQLDLKKVHTITNGSRSYRVTTFDNDPVRPDILFHCTSA